MALCPKSPCLVSTQPVWTQLPSLLSSLGVVLTRGHGEYILLGNTSVEEGRSGHVLAILRCTVGMCAPRMLSRSNPGWNQGEHSQMIPPQGIILTVDSAFRPARLASSGSDPGQ